MRDLKTEVMKNFLWRAMERFGAQGVTFIVSIILARLLDPTVYGQVAMVTAFTGILGVFVDSGLANALIQKKNADDTDFSTVFYFNIIMCSVLYLTLFGLAPCIAKFYNQEELTPIVRVVSLTLIISGIKNVQQAYVSRTMQFKRFFFATLGGTIGAAFLGITMAYLGFGVWALIFQNLFNMVVDTIILWCTVKWRPKLLFSVQRLKELLTYGWKILASKLLDTAYNNLRSLIIGKVYSSSQLGYYNRGKSWPDLLTVNISSSIDSVLFPAMSSAQDELHRVKSMTRKAIQMSTYIIAPMMLGLFATATPLVNIVLTEKWANSISFLRIFCVAYIFYPIRTANMNAIRSIGRSDIYLKLEIVEKTVGFIAIIATMKISVLALAYSTLFTSGIAQLINSWPNKKLLNYGFFEQVKDIMPALLLSIFMSCCVGAINLMTMNDGFKLLLQVIVGVGVYIIGSIILKIPSFNYIMGLIRKSK